MDDDDAIDFSALEIELQAAIEADARYKKENDAKFRAVEQKVATYEEFRDIVKASHLKPLDKSEKFHPAKKLSIWNTIAPKKKQLPEIGLAQNCQQTIQVEGAQLPMKAAEFQKQWRTLNVIDRLNLLKQMGTEHLDYLLQAEIPVGLLGELVQALQPFQPHTADIVFVVRLLEELSKAKRFNLNLQFLSSVEKSACKELMEKLNSSFQDRQQDFAEEGITEWTVLELRNKYKI